MLSKVEKYCGSVPPECRSIAGGRLLAGFLDVAKIRLVFDVRELVRRSGRTGIQVVRVQKIAVLGGPPCWRSSMVKNSSL
jgi:hypothetical protein